MHIHLAQDAPLLLKAAAGTALVLHVGGATVGMASGTAAVLARKGGRLHRTAGNVFFAAMLTMGGVGAIVAPILPDRLSATMGVFVVYLAATGWMAVRRPANSVGRFEAGSLMAALAISAIFLTLAVIGASRPGAMLDDEPAALGYVAAALVALAAASDFGMIRRGGLTGGQRIARHLWRMCLALDIAWGSFAGQPRAQPDFLKGSPLIILPALMVLALMAFWLVRVRRRARPRPAVA